MARIIAVADTLDAMTTNRPYQSGKDLEFSMSRIRNLAGTKFDPAVTDALEAAVEHGKIKLAPVEVALEV
jgi:HD-GYP domain-containing protein (c-di-GMP phosphodiesterase class II)